MSELEREFQLIAPTNPSLQEEEDSEDDEWYDSSDDDWEGSSWDDE